MVRVVLRCLYNVVCCKCSVCRTVSQVTIAPRRLWNVSELVGCVWFCGFALNKISDDSTAGLIFSPNATLCIIKATVWLCAVHIFFKSFSILLCQVFIYSFISWFILLIHLNNRDGNYGSLRGAGSYGSIPFDRLSVIFLGGIGLSMK